MKHKLPHENIIQTLYENCPKGFGQKSPIRGYDS